MIDAIIGIAQVVEAVHVNIARRLFASRACYAGWSGCGYDAGCPNLQNLPRK